MKKITTNIRRILTSRQTEPSNQNLTLEKQKTILSRPHSTVHLGGI